MTYGQLVICLHRSAGEVGYVAEFIRYQQGEKGLGGTGWEANVSCPVYEILLECYLEF